MCIYMYVSMYVLFCHVMYGCFVCVLYAYICMYLCTCIFVCVNIYVCESVCRYACVYLLFYLYKSYLFNCLSCRYLGCYLSVWHCYLGSILAFSFEIVKLNTTTCTRSSTQVIQINLGK